MTKQIDRNTAIEFLLPRHYSGRIPSITYAFGWYEDDVLCAVCTFGSPASPYLCKGVCGEKWKHNVIELNRLCRLETFNKQLSEFVAWCLKQLKPFNYIVVSYSDTQMNHHGYIYQACNFIYTGATKQRTDIFTNDKHGRHYTKENVDSEYRQIRSSKHRYIYFAADRRTKKEMMKDLNYKIQKYPKGDNSNYDLGEYIKPLLIKKQKNSVEQVVNV